MPNLKDIKNRIGSVKKTKQITSAMKLVAAAKLKRAQDAAVAARPYREQLGAVLERVAAVTGDDVDEPLLQSRPEVKKVLLVVLTSDRGLCGPFNNGLLRKVDDWTAERKDAVEVTVRPYGRKAIQHAKKIKGITRMDGLTDVAKMDKMDVVRPLCSDMVAGFVDGEFDEVYVAYNRFVNTLVQEPTFDKVLPLSLEASEDPATRGPAPSGTPTSAAGDGDRLDYRYEPAGPEILGVLLPLYLRTLVLQSFLETEAGFYAAQMTAMENATKNASELIDSLSLEYNRARQAAITTEIIEITSGAAAL